MSYDYYYKDGKFFIDEIPDKDNADFCRHMWLSYRSWDKKQSFIKQRFSPEFRLMARLLWD